MLLHASTLEGVEVNGLVGHESVIVENVIYPPLMLK
jgi:hypothetical protein